MSVIAHILRDAPPGGHARLWPAARPKVIVRLSRSLTAGYEPTELVVVIADRSASLAVGLLAALGLRMPPEGPVVAVLEAAGPITA